MLKVKIVCVGKIKEKYFLDAIAEYSKRLTTFCGFSIVEVAESRIDKANAANIDIALKTEGKSILALREGMLVVLDRLGGLTSSEGIAQLLKTAAQKQGAVTFVVGSSFGLSQEVKLAADATISFGAITLPHQLFRVVLTEQIYRGFCINNGTPYHK